MELENIVANTVYLKAREGKEKNFGLMPLLVTQDLPLVYSPPFYCFFDCVLSLFFHIQC